LTMLRKMFKSLVCARSTSIMTKTLCIVDTLNVNAQVTEVKSTIVYVFSAIEKNLL